MASWSSSVAVTKFALENHCRISSVGMHLLRPPCCLPPASTPPFLPPLSPASNTELRGPSSTPVRNLRSLPDRSPSQNEWGVDGGAVDDRLLKVGFVLFNYYVSLAIMLEQNRETDFSEGGDDEDSDACGFVPKSYTVMTLRHNHARRFVRDTQSARTCHHVIRVG